VYAYVEYVVEFINSLYMTIEWFLLLLEAIRKNQPQIGAGQNVRYAAAYKVQCVELHIQGEPLVRTALTWSNSVIISTVEQQVLK
jgi:hypothetical protein